MTKNKIIMIALAATISLGACAGPRGYSQSGTDHKQTVYGLGGKDLERSDVRKVQRSLAAQGFYKGRIDGFWGEQTSEAILNYQTAHQQERTGTATVETLQEFGVRMDEERQK